MPRPKTKRQLLDLSKDNYLKLTNTVDGLSPEHQQQEFPIGTLNRNIRDVLSHLHHWHTLMIGWEAVAVVGKKPTMPAAGYSWRTVPLLNIWINEQYRETSLNTARQQLDESYLVVRQLIEKYSEEELFTKKHFNWTGSTNLASYLISASSSHYEWARKLINKQLSI